MALTLPNSSHVIKHVENDNMNHFTFILNNKLKFFKKSTYFHYHFLLENSMILKSKRKRIDRYLPKMYFN